MFICKCKSYNQTAYKMKIALLNDGDLLQAVLIETKGCREGRRICKKL